MEEVRECELLPGGLSSQHLLCPLSILTHPKAVRTEKGDPDMVQEEDCPRNKQDRTCTLTQSKRLGLQTKVLGDNLSPSLEHGILIFEQPLMPMGW